METRRIKISDFDYPLPDERIALYPLARRDSCRLIVSAPSGEISHARFSDLPDLVPSDSLIVVNETRVIKARLEFFKQTGSRIEIFLLEPLSPSDYQLNFASEETCRWCCMVGNRKRWKDDPLEKSVEIPGVEGVVTLTATLLRELPGSDWEVEFSWDNPKATFASVVEAVGNIPIPPYLKRESEASDTSDYQTVFSKTEGSVAAPTAGLHFTPELISALERSGNRFAKVTLHVGAGTFQPVKSEEIGGHPMHAEWISVSKETIRLLADAIERGQTVVAVGTTSVRTLESLPYFGLLAKKKPSDGELAVTQWMPYADEYSDNPDCAPEKALRNLLNYLEASGQEVLEGFTSIMIAPGFRWRIVNRLVTNFHQPKSTLLLLVSSFLNPAPGIDGTPQWRKIYDEALGLDYRFLSYGDACYLAPVESHVRLPLSKSVALRQAAIFAAAGKIGEVSRTLLDSCDDTEDFLNAAEILDSAPRAVATEINFRLGAAPLRFFTALAASTPGKDIILDADEHLKRRPIAPLLDSLRQAGADIECLGAPASLPLRIRGKRLEGGEIAVPADISSQYLSAVMLVAPTWKRGAKIEISTGSRVSGAYVDMTVGMMRRNGVTVKETKSGYEIQPTEYKIPGEPVGEPDWSAAAFFYEAALMMPHAALRFDKLTHPLESLQGDAKCTSFFKRIGVETIFEADGSARLNVDSGIADGIIDDGEVVRFDLSSNPDLAPPLVVGMTLRGIKFRLTGIASLRKKESDRVATLMSELTKLGYTLRADEDSMGWEGLYEAPKEKLPLIATHADHRIAMAFAPAEAMGLCRVADRDVVTKSYPEFWDNFSKLTWQAR